MLTSLDDLLDTAEPHATFHDGELCAVRADFENAILVMKWRLGVGDADATDQAYIQDLPRPEIAMNLGQPRPHGENDDFEIPVRVRAAA